MTAFVISEPILGKIIKKIQKFLENRRFAAPQVHANSMDNADFLS